MSIEVQGTPGTQRPQARFINTFYLPVLGYPLEQADGMNTLILLLEEQNKLLQRIAERLDQREGRGDG